MWWRRCKANNSNLTPRKSQENIMKNTLKSLTSLAISIAAFTGTAAYSQAFELTSPDLSPTQPIAMKHVFNGFGCTGENISPALNWKNPPAGTKSFAVMVHDADAPTGGAGFWHWVLVNLPASTTGLAQGAGAAASKVLPETARQINTDFGAPGWGGPCPPQGRTPHRYTFTVYALGVDKLDLPANATASLTGFMANVNALGKASIEARFGR
jgi:Raf kinase inhibitor-like YbhB/YbcL family protein